MARFQAGWRYIDLALDRRYRRAILLVRNPVKPSRYHFMSTTADLVLALKKELKLAQMTYADLARALGKAESSARSMYRHPA